MLYWSHWLPLTVLLPLVGGALTPVFAYRHRSVAPWWALGVMSGTSLAALALILRIAESGPFSYVPGGWEVPYGIELRFDEFSAFISVICLIGLLAIMFSLRYAEWLPEMPKSRIAYYYALILLNLGGMIGFSVTGDLFNLFVFLEILSLTGYALVAVGGEKLAEMAAFKYLLIGAIASVLVLFGTAMLLSVTGTLNMADVTSQLAAYDGPKAPVATAFALITIGFLTKAALFPLHVWLPDAHSIAPTPINAISSGLSVKVGLVGMLRIYQIFYGSGVLDLSGLNHVLLWLGAAAILVGAFFALYQDDVKLMLAYSTISNIGYIVLGFGLASNYGVMGASVHIFNHAIIKAGLFFAVGAMLYQTGYRTLTDLRGIGLSMPITTAALSIGAVSIVGIPPTAGFLCKWYIALGSIEADELFFGFVLIFGALFIFIYYIRMVNAFYFKPAIHDEVRHAKEAPLSMQIPILTMAALCLIMGMLGRVPLTFIEPAVLRMLAPLGG